MSTRHTSGKEVTLSGRYTLRRQIAGGGMGVVWEASDAVLGRLVAVKVLSPALAADERFLERFRREARAAAGLTHPNVAQVFDYGEDGATHYIVMELLKGETLAARLRREGRLPPGEAARIGAQTADALEAAHRAGIVHRDVKPANIMLTRPDDQVKVMDFGIAAAGHASSLTATGSMLGTAVYMSPEHVSGQPATPASDVYSLAVVVYESLTGGPPFEMATPVATAAAHVQTAPTPVGTRAPDVPAPLAAAVERGLAKDPAARPATAAAFADQLRAGATAGSDGTPSAPMVQLRTRRTDPLPEPPPPGPSTRGPRGAILILVGVAIAGLLLWAVIANLTGGGSTAAPPAQSSPPRSSPSSSAVAQVTIPSSIIGMSAEDATKALEALGLSVGDTVTVKAGHDEKGGVVTDTDPPPGTAAPPNSSVTLYVTDSHGHGKDHGHGGGDGGGGD